MSRRLKKVGEASSYHVKISEWPADERPREKLLQRGSGALSDAELLAILIRTGTGHITAVDLASTLLREFESLPRLASRSAQELKHYKGLGDAKSLLLVAAFELGRRAASRIVQDREQIRSPGEIARRFGPALRDLQQEIFKVLLLDSANHLLREVTVSVGILNSALVHPREVFRQAIMEPAASVILMHNHPSGNPDPSSEDLEITRQLVEAGKIMGIPVRDHLILAGENYASFAERGLL